MRTHDGPITTEDMIAEAKLELKFRSSVYPRRVSDGRMRQDEADFRNRRMQGILDRLMADKAREDAQGQLALDEQPD